MGTKLTNEQIDQFLSGKCSQEEYVQILNTIETDDSYSHLLAVWQQVGINNEVPIDASKRMLDNIKQVTQPRRINIAWMAAASVALLILGTVVYFLLQATTGHAVKEEMALARNEKNSAGSWKALTNPTTERTTYWLPDSSEVILYQGASVKYPAAFGKAAGTRTIVLKGNAYFHVTKDSQRPFTVYTGTVSTTALGTSFTIFEHAEFVQVMLHTGKVVLKKETATLHGWKQDVVLMPGQQMNYNKAQGYCKVTGSEHKYTASIVTQKVSAPLTFTLLFNNEPLSKVMDDLSSNFKTTIRYNKAEISEGYFSGKIQSTDSLAAVLDLIGRLNGLDIHKEGSHFTVSIKQE